MINSQNQPVYHEDAAIFISPFAIFIYVSLLPCLLQISSSITSTLYTSSPPPIQYHTITSPLSLLHLPSSTTFHLPTLHVLSFDQLSLWLLHLIHLLFTCLLSISLSLTLISLPTALLILYLPTAALGYMQFGSNVAVNILLMVHGPAVTVVEVLMLFNNLFTYVLIMNPLSQSLEEAASLPTREYILYFFLFCLFYFLLLQYLFH